MSNAWLIPFTDYELEAIYTAIERAPSDAVYEERWETVIEKICAKAVGDATPVGAIGRTV